METSKGERNRMKIGFIGAGKVGFSLGRYLKENDLKISGYFSKSINSAKDAAKFTNTNYFHTLDEIISTSDILFITTPDNIIPKVWEEIKSLQIENKIFCHCSGSLSSGIFSNISQKNAFGYSIHPLFAINDKFNSYKELSKAFFTIEGDEKYLDYFYNLFKALGNGTYIISKENKIKYHASAVFASNLVIGLFNMSANMLEECGFNREDSLKALMPLFIGNAEKIGKCALTDSLTGPIERNDTDTINKHLKVLNEEEGQVYKILSKNLVTLAKEKNPEKNYSSVEKILKKD